MFPGQGSQFPGMGKDLFEGSEIAREKFELADRILGFPLSEIMFEGTAEDLKQTRVTQPAVFLQSVISYYVRGDKYKPSYVAGHSLGEFTALVANATLSFEDGLRLVSIRANAMQRACEIEPGTMAAILGMEDEVVEQACSEIEDIVIPANYNCPGQLVISGTKTGISKAIALLSERGAKRAIELPVSGAFHSPLMNPAEEELAIAIESTHFNNPSVPVFQNCTARMETDPKTIRKNLISQLTSPVLWTQTIINMKAAGVKLYVEVGGNGKTLTGFIKKVDRELETDAV